LSHAVRNQLHLGAENIVTFEGWVEGAFGKWAPTGAGFTNARLSLHKGVIETNRPMFLSTKAPLVLGFAVAPGDRVAARAANGEDIPYGKPYCVFVPIDIP
jgi:hypothetical protein